MRHRDLKVKKGSDKLVIEVKISIFIGKYFKNIHEFIHGSPGLIDNIEAD